MHVAGVTLDLNWFLQFIFTVFIIAVGVLHLVKNTASKYFEVGANFEAHSDRTAMPPAALMDDLVCVVCGNSGPKQCSRCKAVRYCSQKCQEKHWKSGHQKDCKVIKLSASVRSTQNGSSNSQFKAFVARDKPFAGIALVPACGISKPIDTKQPKDILFPYDEFVKLFNWDKPGFPPCGLLNCGNSCFANVVLQCLASTRPLVAYLLEKGHRTECIRSDWCFLCEFQTHLERASQSLQPFSPTNIISRLPNIGGNLGYGRQEDAHEFMRFAIDTMQSICLDEFGGEKAVPRSLQETTIIQHIFGGHLQSQVICTKCNNISNQHENMMDLTVEIHGEAASLEECLDQFTVKEWLHGDNMYKCDGCNDYVKAWKRLTVKWAPNILTIALKRFQSGRFGKLNKRVTFPETLDLSPYMSDDGDGTDVYTLYAVVVHVDMLNASFFGHYICYTKDLCGNWYKLDDCKVTKVALEEVLSQGAYMLLYSRVKARPAYLRALESSNDEQKMANGEVELSLNEQIECPPHGESESSDGSVCLETHQKESPICINYEARGVENEHNNVAILESTSSVEKGASNGQRELCFVYNRGASGEEREDVIINSYRLCPSISNCPEGAFPIAGKASTLREEDLVNTNLTNHQPCQAVMDKISSCFERDLSASDRGATQEVSEDTHDMYGESRSFVAEDVEFYSNGYAHEDESALQVEHVYRSDSGFNNMKRATNFRDGNGVESVEIMDDSS